MASRRTKIERRPLRAMKTKRRIAAIVLLLLLGAVAYGLFRTGQPASAPAMNTKAEYGGAAQAPIVDHTPLLTAQRLAQMPTSAEEKPFAEEALRLGDHEMDLAFAAAVRDAEEHPPVLSAEAKEIQARLQQAERAEEVDKAELARLTAAYEKAGADKKDALDDQLDVAKAQLELDQHEALEAQIGAEKTRATQTSEQATSSADAGGARKHSNLNREESTALVKATKLRASEQKSLAGFGKRIDDQKQLAEVYAKWTDVVAGKQRLVVHRMLTGVAIILGILLVGIFFDSWFERF